MRIILALICFLAMMMHAFFGYFLYVRGESVFEPDNMIVAVQKKVAPNVNKLSIFQKKSDHIEDPVLKEQAKNAAFYEKPNDGLIKTEERIEGQETSQAASAVPETAATDANTAETNTTKAPAAENAESAPAKTEAAQEPKTEYVPFSTGWSGFLQVENALITVLLFFLGFSICCVKGRGPASRWVFGLNFIFWGTLGCAIYYFLPVNTPLVIFNMKFSFPQWWMVIGTSALAAVLSFLLFLNAFRRPIDPAVAKAKKEEKKGEPEMKAQEPAKPAAKNRFGFGRSEPEKKEEPKSEPIIIPPVKPTETPTTPDKRPE